MGKQAIGSTVTITGYWILGIPISLLAVFYYGWGIVGLWVGPSVAIVFNSVFYYILIIKADWDSIARDAEKRRLLR